MNHMEHVLQKWCDELILETDWPKDIPIEEQLDKYIFPQIQKTLTEMENDREYYQNRFYTMQWAFRRILKAYGQIVKSLEQANIHLFTEDIMKALTEEE